MGFPFEAESTPTGGGPGQGIPAGGAGAYAEIMTPRGRALGVALVTATVWLACAPPPRLVSSIDAAVAPRRDAGSRAPDAPEPCGGACLAPLRCHGSTGRCVECETDDQCPTGSGRCLASLRCAECVDASDCGLGEVCEGSLCVECGTSQGCPSERPICDFVTHRCVGCTDDFACEVGSACVEGTCRPCDEPSVECPVDRQLDAVRARYCERLLASPERDAAAREYVRLCTQTGAHERFDPLANDLERGFRLAPDGQPALAIDDAAFTACVPGNAVFADETLFNRRDVDHACEHAFHRRARVGDACATSLACASEAFCLRGALAAAGGRQQCGTCTLRAPVGGTCRALDDECADGAYCDAVAGTCLALSHDGDACEPIRGCPGPEGLACIAGRCARPLDLGAACADRSECASGICEGGLCRAAAELDASCSASWVCVPEARCVGGTCVPLPGDGEGCDAGRCAPGHACIAGTCRPSRADGESCIASAQCPLGSGCNAQHLCGRYVPERSPCDARVACAPGLACVEGTCLALPSVGTDCTRTGLCAAGICDGRLCREATLGAPCALDDPTVVDPCGLDSECVVDAAGRGTCWVSRAPDCDPALEHTCEPTSVCVDATCVLRCGAGWY